MNREATQIEDLQARIAFQEDMIQSLSARVAEQERDIQTLHLQLRHLSDKVKAIGDNYGNAMGAEAPPPHY